MKLQHLGLVHNFPKKTKKTSCDSKCKTMKIEVMLENVGVKENVTKTHVARKCFLAHLRTKL
jgi:hypothetical protein